MKKLAIYPGTFDPITLGHLELIKRSLSIFDEVIVAAIKSPKKTPLFDIDQRLELINGAVTDCENVIVESFEGLLMKYAKDRGAVAVIRGLRAISDFEYELQMAMMNRRIERGVETVFLMPSEKYSFISSTMVKEVAELLGPVETVVPPNVVAALKGKFK